VADRAVSVEAVFDRAAASSLALAYRILVPERHARAKPRSEQGDDRSCSPERPGPTKVKTAVVDDRLTSAGAGA